MSGVSEYHEYNVCNKTVIDAGLTEFFEFKISNSSSCDLCQERCMNLRRRCEI